MENNQTKGDNYMLSYTERTECGVFGEIIVLENGIELFPDEWNGEVYTTNGKTYKPVQKPISYDDNGEPEQWEIIGYEEI